MFKKITFDRWNGQLVVKQTKHLGLFPTFRKIIPLNNWHIGMTTLKYPQAIDWCKVKEDESYPGNTWMNWSCQLCNFIMRHPHSRFSKTCSVDSWGHCDKVKATLIYPDPLMIFEAVFPNLGVSRPTSWGPLIWKWGIFHGTLFIKIKCKFK